MAKRIRLQALRKFYFGGKDVEVGDVFETSVVDAVRLRGRGKARFAGGRTVTANAFQQAPATYRTQDPVADQPPPAPAAHDVADPDPHQAEGGGSPPAPRRRRRNTYQTRDLRAEE